MSLARQQQQRWYADAGWISAWRGNRPSSGITMLSLSFGFVLLRPGCSTPLLTWDYLCYLSMATASISFFQLKKKSSHLWVRDSAYHMLSMFRYLHPFPWDLSDWQSMLWYPELEQSRACTHRNGVTNQPETTTHSSGFPWYADLNWNTCTYCFPAENTFAFIALEASQGRVIITYAGTISIRTNLLGADTCYYWAWRVFPLFQGFWHCIKMRVKNPPDCYT